MQRLAEQHPTVVAGIDVGGTKTLVALFDEGGAGIVEGQRATPTEGGAALAAFLGELLTEVATQAGVPVMSIGAAGLGLPGVVDPEAGTLRHAVNLGIGDDPVDLSAPLSELIDGPVRVANDVNLAAVGAAEILGLKGDVAYLSIGTGLALGLVLGGEVYHGATGSAGEIGHLPIDPHGPVCECGQRGCLEMVVSGRAIARRWPVENGSSGVAGGPGADGAMGRSSSPDAAAQPAAALLRAAVAGDPRAIAVRDDVCDHLAGAVALVAQTVDPEVIVLGGGVAEGGQLLLDELRRALDRRGERSPFVAALHLADRVMVLPSQVSAGAVGAASTARQALDRRAVAGLRQGAGPDLGKVR